MQLIDGAGKVPRTWSYIRTSCTSCHNICCTACVRSTRAVSLHAGVSVLHSSVSYEDSFSDLASRTLLVRHNGMYARHHTSCTVSAMVDLVGFRSRVWHSSTCHNTSTTHTPHSASISAEWHASPMQFITPINLCRDISSYSFWKSIVHQP
jgi:hypothetical protein